MPLGLFKKAWQKQLCSFELQEYKVGERGWHSITEASGEIPSKAEASEFFKPGNHYRVIARALTDEKQKAGTYVGVVWEHYEPEKGLKPAPKPKVAKPSKPKDAVALMDEYADEIDRVLEPIVKIGDVMNRLRDSLLAGAGTPPAQGEGGEAYTIAPIEFDGKAPWMMHPYIVHTIAEEVKGVIDYAGTRFERVLGRGVPSEVPAEEREEEPLLPSISEFEEKPEEEEAPVEEVEELPEIPPTEAREEFVEKPKLVPPVEPIEKIEKLPEAPIEEVPVEPLPPVPVTGIEEEKVEEIPKKRKKRRKKK